MKRLLLFLIGFIVTTAVNAGKVTEQQAMQKAQQFMKGKNIVLPRKKALARSESQVTSDAFYIFNVENNGGFVIVSGDDRTPEVLGYSEKGYLDMDSMPPHIKAWLDGYAQQIAQIQKSGHKASLTRAPSNHEAIEPLLTTTWGQDYPYNMNCPNFFSLSDKCVTGCIATAMAQVMYYHRAKSTNQTIAEIPSYKCRTYWPGYGNITVDAISNSSNIDWYNMQDSYDGSETDVQKKAVANLMSYCGVSVKMDYATGGSSAFFEDVPRALKQFFDYSENTTLVWRGSYADEDWEELIYAELSKDNPIFYGGRNSFIGHAFVCDGYDGNGYYHINWGWEGLSDSYFLLSALNPDAQGTGGSSEGYNDGQCALIGAVPNGEILRLTSQNVSLTGTTSFSLSGIGDNITVPVRWNVKNQTGTSHNYDHAIGLYKNGEFVKVLNETGSSVSFTVDEVVIVDASLNIETNLATGVYQLYALSRSSGEDKWFRNENSSNCFITLVVKDGAISFYVGKPAVAENVINFADDEVKRICVENWDTDGDGEISYEEAASVNDFGFVFDGSNIKTFDEAQFFTGITSFSLTMNGGANCSSLTSIKLPSSVISIRDQAFYNCNALTSIEIPASVTEIGGEAFAYCHALNSVDISSSVTTIGKHAWHECFSLTDFHVDVNNPYYCDVDGVIFSKDEKNLILFPNGREGTYTIPERTEIINSNAFEISNIGTIVIPASVTSIGDEAFSSLIHLNEITIPSTITSVGIRAFFSCVNLKSVVFEGSISSIPEGLFGACWSLKNIEIPDYISSIGPLAFWDCMELKEITIPSNITSIGDNAFSNSGLTKVMSFMQNPCEINTSVFENVYSNATLYVPVGSKAKYEALPGWSQFADILEMATEVPITFGEKPVTTYTANYNMDFSGTDEIKAYVATGYDYDTGTVWLTRVKDVPAGMAVMIMGTPKETYDIPVQLTSGTYFKNMFVANTTGNSMTLPQTSGDMTNYYLSNGMFKSSTGSNTIGAGKCYLQIPTVAPTPSVGDSRSVTLNGNGFGSFSATQDLDFTDVEGLKAYAATGYDDASGTIWLTRVKRVSAGTGLLLMGAAGGSYTIPSTAVKSYYANMMVGNPSGPTLTIYTTSGDMTNYYLKGNKLLKADGTDGNSIGEGKAYMQIPSAHVTRSIGDDPTENLSVYDLLEQPEVISMQVMTRGLDGDGDTTGIHEAVQPKQDSDVYYNLNGQRVENPGKGLYIHNGRKVVIK